MFNRSVVGTTTSQLRALNTSAVLLALLRYGALARAELATLSGLSPTTITKLTTELIEQGLISEEGIISTDEPTVGRPKTALALVPQARYVVAVHINIGYVRVSISDLLGRPIYSQNIDFDQTQDSQQILEMAAQAIRNLIKKHQVNTTLILGVGVAASGLVDPTSGLNVLSPNLGWHDVPLAQFFQEQTGLPIMVDNNVRAMALGEALFGLAQSVQSVAFVYARVGVGAGFVVNGEVFRGSAGGAGEIGHTTIILEGGDPCRCGNTGCLETLVSARTIVRQALQILNEYPDSIAAQYLSQPADQHIDQVFVAARAGDERIQAILHRCAMYMGVGLANLVNIFNPALIIMGGMFARGADLLLPAMLETVHNRTFAGLGQQVRIEATQFKDEGLVGAAALALSAFFYRQESRQEMVVYG